MDIVIQLFLYTLNTDDTEKVKSQKNVRESEYSHCFRENLSRKYVNTVHVFLSSESDEIYFKNIAGSYSYKCKFVQFGKQPNYKDLIEYIQTNIGDNKIVSIMNSDIILDTHLPFDIVKNNVVGMNMFGITRHEITDEFHKVCNFYTCRLVYDYYGSHDMFIMHTPISKSIKLEEIDFKQNLYGAEAIFQKTLKNAGYSFTNPAFQIKGFHNHKDYVRFEFYNTIGTSDDFSQPPSIITNDIKSFIKELDIQLLVEIGCHNGKDTKDFAQLHPSSRIVCFEPDPRNLISIEKNNIKDIAEVYPFAVSNTNGIATFFQSSGVVPDPESAAEFGDWSLSSSLKYPIGHLDVHPWCKFENKIDVQTIRLDDFEPLKNTKIDFIWADVQGAEDLVFSGATETLKNTRYVYTEYSNVELYDGQLNRDQILTLFGKDWTIVHDFGGDVLLRNVTL